MTHPFPPGLSEQEVDALRGRAKEALRQRFASLRRTLSPAARRERSASMCAALIQHEAFRHASVVSSYAPLKFEIDPTEATQAAQALGKLVALPRLSPGTLELMLHRYHDGDRLFESALSVREPGAESPSVSCESVELVLVPGLAFDQRGFRLGYGKGCYDRLLPRLTQAVRVGLCFELSLLPEVPETEFDTPVDIVATERRMIICQR